MELFQTGRSDPFCGQNQSNQCYGPPPSEEQRIEQWEAMQNNHLLVSAWGRQLAMKKTCHGKFEARQGKASLPCLTLPSKSRGKLMASFGK